MKKFIFPALFYLALMFGCTEKKAETNTHQHEDGTTHEAHEETAAPAQEEFDATGTIMDTAHSASPATEGEHQHGDGDAHNH